MGKDLTRRVAERNGTGGSGGGEVAQQDMSLAGRIRSMEQQFAMAMPKGTEATQLIRDALTALRTTRNLDRCESTSVLGALMTCAQLGLRPSVPGLGHAWVMPFWDNRDRCHKAQLIIGYQGYRELAQRSGQIATLIGRTVYANDEFDIDYGLADNLIHKPALRGDRGEPVGYYAIVKYTSGGYAFWHMSRDEVERHRDRYAMARTKDGTIVGPWRDNFDEMAVKTAFLRLAKWMPKSTEMASAIAADNSVRVDLTPDQDALFHAEQPQLSPADTTEPAAPDTPTEEAGLPVEEPPEQPSDLFGDGGQAGDRDG